jgi:ribosome-associated translation inhibitor RaiA
LIMQIEVKSRAPDAAPLAPMATERLRFALRRLAWWVQRVQVRLEDDNGPRKGQDKRCSVQLKTRQGHDLIVSEVADDWRVAFERVVSRLARSLAGLHRRAAAVPRSRRGTAFLQPTPDSLV